MQNTGWGKGISIKVKEFPTVLLEFKEIKKLEIQFTGEIDIPDELAKVKIAELNLHGKISNEGIKRIKNLLPQTNIIINETQIE